ncbi:MAG TPA: PDR/VanB family oxidoreductase [Hyphomicrobiales bacterium]|nr:PDR/VanB family oxidoreductase [Hyphomicrobiales bacterium]
MPDLELKVAEIEDLTPQIKRFAFTAADGGPLPAFEAGAHIDVFTGIGLTRSYSLAGDPADPSRYVTAILREPKGGGSTWMHDQVKVGDVLKASGPTNNFPLEPDAGRHHLIAGGIGITPMLAMGHALARGDRPFTLDYCTKSVEETAFLEEVRQVFGDRVTFHHDGGDPSRGIDLKAALAERPEGTHLYLCGPAGLLRAAREAARHWPEGTVHYELFSSLRSDQERAVVEGLPNEAFEIELAQSGLTLTVPADKTILEVLNENGIPVIKVCEEGYCGTCQVTLLGGKADHRDEVLDDNERASNTLIQVCISRAMPGEKLILDL